MKSVVRGFACALVGSIACARVDSPAPIAAAPAPAQAGDAVYDWTPVGAQDASIESVCAGPCPDLPTVEKTIADDPHWRRCLAYSDDDSLRPGDRAIMERGRCGDLRYVATSVTYAGVIDWFDRDGVLIGEHVRSDAGSKNRGTVPRCNEPEPADTLCYVALSPDEPSTDPLAPSWHAKE